MYIVLDIMRKIMSGSKFAQSCVSIVNMVVDDFMKASKFEIKFSHI